MYDKSDKLYWISIGYEPGYKGITNKMAITNYLKEYLTESYWGPTEIKDFPGHTHVTHRYTICKWFMPTKTVELDILINAINIRK